MKTTRLSIALTLGLGLTLVTILLVSPGRAAPPAGPLALSSPLVAPPPNTHTAPMTTPVSVIYSEAVDPSSVSTQTFAIYAMQTGQLTETYGVNGATVSLTPSQPFHPGELVQTTATTGLLSLIDGQGTVSPIVWQFLVAVPYGTARFVDSGQTLESGAADVALGDLDGDGHLDAFIANGNGFHIRESVWLNDGTGVFSRTQYLAQLDSRAAALGDLDGDGDLDAFVVHGRTDQSNLVYVNDGTGAFTVGWVQPSNLAVSADVALGDLDGDGDLDAMVMNGGGFDDAIWFNDGTGNFPVRQALAGTGYLGDSVELGDLDGDGDLDALVGNWSGSTGFGLYPWWNDGSGTLTQGAHVGNAYTLDVALGDLDGDGDLDAFLAVGLDGQGDGVNEVWVNDGSGVFTDTGQTLSTRNSRAVALGDLDGDGDLDAYVVNSDSSNNQNRVWLNDGSGVFVDSGQLLGSTESTTVALGDVDGDGDLDALEANHSTSPDNRVWLNMNQADLGITKSVVPAMAAAGERVTFTLAYSNTGPQTAMDVVIEDVVPVSVTNPSASSVGAAITPTGPFSYTWDVADLAPGAGGVITITGVLSADLPSGTVITNTATITAFVVDGNQGNNTGSADVTVPNCFATPNNGVTVYQSLDAQALRDAVAAASPGGTVKVAGICAGAVWDAGHDQVVYIHDKDLTVRGGYAPDDWAVSDPDANPTTLDALNVPNHRVVYVYKNAVTLENLILTNGFINIGVDTGGGGGIFSDLSTLTVSNTLITNNHGRVGGGIFIYQGSVTLVDSQVVSNTASGSNTGGGGVFVYQGGASLTIIGDSLIAYNDTGPDGRGGGIWLYYGDATQYSGEIRNNYGRYGGGVHLGFPSASFTQMGGVVGYNNTSLFGHGGGLWVGEGAAYLYGGQVISNTTLGDGGGLHVSNQWASLTVSGTSILSNTAAGRGGGVYNSGATVLFTAGDITSNTAMLSGGGVYVHDANAVFTQTGGIIRGNRKEGIPFSGGGGGLYVELGRAALSGGYIVANSSGSDGGGVYVDHGDVTASGLSISGNTTSNNGGGVFIAQAGATFTQTGMVTITLNSAANGGGGVYVNNGNVVLNGGQIASNTASNDGGGVYLTYGSMTLSGGQITSNTAGSDGGGVFVWHTTAAFTQTGGTIANNDATSGGGGVYVALGSAMLDGSGAQISDNTAAWGGGVYVESGQFVQDGASAVARNHAGSGGGVYVSSGSTVTMSGGQVTNNTAASLGGGISVNGGAVAIEGGQVCDNVASNVGGGMHVASGSVDVSGGQICHNDGWSGGGIYLHDGSVTLSGGEIISNTAVGSGGGVFVNTVTASFAQSGSGTIAHNTANGSSSTAGGGGVYVNYGSATLSGGQVRDNDARRGGGVFVNEGGATLAISGAEVAANTASLYGGGVFVQHGQASMSSGQVFNNVADDQGGGVYVLSGGFDLQGGDVVSNTTVTEGGGFFTLNGDVTNSAGRILSNTAEYGAGVYVDQDVASFAQSGSGVVGGNVAGNAGGGIYVDAGTVTLGGGEIRGNRAENGNGGGVFVGQANQTTAALTVTGAMTISGNYAQGYGGGVYIGPAAVSFDQGLIETNDADGCGGGIFTHDSTVVLSGTQMISNTASRGGGLCLQDGAVVMTGTQVLSNTTTGEGGGLAFRSGSATLSDVEVVGNTSSSSGGGLFVETGQVVLVQTAGIIADNDAAGMGGGLFVQDGRVTQQGVGITGNTAPGGGLAVVSGTVTILGSAFEGNSTGIYVGGSASGSLLLTSSVISDSQVAGVVYDTQATSSFTVTLGGTPGAANTFGNNGPAGTVNITVTAPSTHPPVSALYNDWGVAGLAAIEDTLHHQFDNLALARVDYYTLTLEADPLVQWADGVSPIVLTATVGGLLGPVPGDVVSFTTNLGDLGAAAASTAAGQQASVELTSLVTGTANVTATAGVDALDIHPATVSVEFAYAAPTANDDSYGTLEDIVLTEPAPGVLDNDSDPGVGPLAVTLGVGPVTGTLDLRANGAFTYTPPLHYNGLVTFTYIADNGRLTDTATVSITVTPVNDVPTISDIPNQITTAGTPVGPIPFTIGDVETDPSALLLTSDWDDLVLVAPGNAVFGGSGVNRTLTITPTSGETGVTTFTISVNDGEDIVSDTFVLTVIEYQIYLPLLMQSFP